jgi:hypothetical protein
MMASAPMEHQRGLRCGATKLYVGSFFWRDSMVSLSLVQDQTIGGGTHIRIHCLCVPDHAENSKDTPTDTHWLAIGVAGVRKPNHIWLKESQWQAHQLIAMVQCGRLPIPGEMGLDDQVHCRQTGPHKNWHPQIMKERHTLIHAKYCPCHLSKLFQTKFILKDCSLGNIEVGTPVVCNASVQIYHGSKLHSLTQFASVTPGPS